MAFLAPDPLQSTFFIPGGNTPASGGKVFFYIAGSSTKQTVYKDPAGTIAHTNPIVLDSGGNIPSGGEVWFATGATYKAIFAPATDSDPPVSPYWTKDDLSGVNDVGAQTGVEWLTGPVGTFVSATSFTVAGDQTAIFQVGRRVRTTNTGGTIYGTVTASVFGALTTVTVLTDSGVLDSGLTGTVVSYGLLSVTNPSIPALANIQYRPSSTLRIGTFQDRNAVFAAQDETQDAYMLQNASLNASVAANVLTVALKNASGSDCSISSPATIAFRSTTSNSGAFSVRTVTAALSMTVSATSTLGFANSESGRIHVGLIDNAGTVEMCLWRALSGLDLVMFPEWQLQSTTAEGGAGAADSAATLYSTTARTGVAFRYLGSFEIQYGTALWSNAPTLVQTATRYSPRPGDRLTLRTSYTGLLITSSGALATVTTVVPLDDTIPTATEGQEVLSLTYAPISAVNILKLNFNLQVAVASPSVASVGFLNKDAGSAVSAIQAFGDNGAGNAGRILSAQYMSTAAATTASVWRVRFGPVSAATGYVNGSGGTRLFGGTDMSYVQLEEYFS